MSNYSQVFSSPLSGSIGTVGQTEVALATVSGINTDSPSRRIQLRGSFMLTSATGATGIVIRVRRGTDITGTAVITSTDTPIGAIGSTDEYVIDAIDVPGEINNGSYTLTVFQQGATANGSTINAILEAVLL